MTHGQRFVFTATGAANRKIKSIMTARAIRLPRHVSLHLSIAC
tara:strand:- start:724 stop:852 length:129 start_codon:yes stop_codon:yes gene_type:complete